MSNNFDDFNEFLKKKFLEYTEIFFECKGEGIGYSIQNSSHITQSIRDLATTCKLEKVSSFTL